ncbi:unnamed protein product [Anisakis simplex]|uniref:Dipeptidyl peptidase 9 n=1 Tax=Anisakis simplex TaxID=6269 RepID=A0A0M3JXB5_ANISI|nr:unnamed protein product [Anisakis simplex]
MAPDVEQYDVQNLTWTELLDHAKNWRNISSTKAKQLCFHIENQLCKLRYSKRFYEPHLQYKNSSIAYKQPSYGPIYTGWAFPRKGLGTSLHHIFLYTDANGLEHVLALGGGNQSSQQTIYSATLCRPFSQRCTQTSVLTLSVHLEIIILQHPPPAELAALCERQRTALTWGIASYEYEPRTDALLYSDSDHVYVSKTNGIHEVGKGVSGCPLNAHFCPVDSDIVAFVANRNIYIDRLGTVIYCTNSTNDISNGCSSFIMQEEFDRFTGIWWSPGPEPLLVYERVDESNVVELQFSSPGHVRSRPMKYPLAGSMNATSTLHLVTDCSLCVDLVEQFYWYEYLARVGWLPDGSAVWAILMSRLQDRYALVLIPKELFTGQSSTDASVITLIEENTPTWFNIDNSTKFLQSTNSNTISFFQASDRNDNTHLYLQQVELNSRGKVVSRKNVPITSGDWSVSKHVSIHVDERRHHVYFVANKHHPADTNLYSRMECEMSINSDIGFVCWESSLRLPPRCAFYRIQHITNDHLPTATLQYLISMPYTNPLNDHNSSLSDIGAFKYLYFFPFILYIPYEQRANVYPEIIEYKSNNSNRIHYALLIRPMNSVKGIRYPVIQFVYGGPGVQLVCNMWTLWVTYQKFTSLGYAVVMVDGRGSANRGISFETAIKGQLISALEVDDQLEGLNEVAKRTDDLLDLSRVAVMGWSYGGFMALMCLAKNPETYRAAVAGGAVTCWNLYDTAYTERYLGMPGDHYARSSVLKYINQLPNETDRLLIVQGLMDENVHFSHTEALIETLITAGKPFRLQIFPSERHGVRASEACEFHDAVVLDFLQKALTVRKSDS